MHFSRWKYLCNIYSVIHMNLTRAFTAVTVDFRRWYSLSVSVPTSLSLSSDESISLSSTRGVKTYDLLHAILFMPFLCSSRLLVAAECPPLFCVHVIQQTSLPLDYLSRKCKSRWKLQATPVPAKRIGTEYSKGKLLTRVINTKANNEQNSIAVKWAVRRD